MSESSSSEEEEMFLLCLLQAEEEEKRQKRFWVHNINKKRCQYREFHHLFNDLLKDESKFFQYFRMSTYKFFELHDMLKDKNKKESTRLRRPVSTEERLAVCLRFLATGDSFKTIAFSYRLGEATVRCIVYETCVAIWKILQPKCMPQPDRAMWERIEKGYKERWNFPNCVGSLDGKHVVFEKPPNSGSLFFNYKKTFSIVLLALVDDNYKFIYVDVGGLGKNSDGGIFANSVLAKRLQHDQLDMPPNKALPGTNVSLPHVIVADEAFPLLPNVMRPYPGDETKGDKTKRIYNYRHSRARNTSEDAFGILTKKFRIYKRVMQMTPENLTTCVLATCVLHNYLREDCMHLLPEVPEEQSEALQDTHAIGGRSSNKALGVRNAFKDFFNSAEGSVSWQDKVINVGRITAE